MKTFEDHFDYYIKNIGRSTTKEEHEAAFFVWEQCLKANKEPVAEVPCSAGLSCAWIDVKERLPELGQIALWWNEDIRMIEFGSAGSFNGENVPYWMPLPDPPAR